MTNPYQPPSAGFRRTMEEFDFPLCERVRITPEIMTEGYFTTQRAFPTFLRIAAFSVGLVAITVCSLLFWDALPQDFFVSLIVGSVFFVPGGLLILWSIYGQKLSRWQIYRQYCRDPSANAWTDFEFTAHGVVATSGTGVLQIPWGKISHWTGSDAVMTVVYRRIGLLTPMMFLVLPIRSFSATTNDFLELMRNQA